MEDSLAVVHAKHTPEQPNFKGRSGCMCICGGGGGWGGREAVGLLSLQLSWWLNELPPLHKLN